MNSLICEYYIFIECSVGMHEIKKIDARHGALHNNQNALGKYVPVKKCYDARNVDTSGQHADFHWDAFIVKLQKVHLCRQNQLNA